MFDDPLHPNVIRIAYSNGFFPMPHPETGQVMWFNPDPRAIIPLDALHVSKSLHRFLRKTSLTHSYDLDFAGVMHGCANRPDTWINEEFLKAYTRLHKVGMAHSVEIWKDETLVGGVYGVSIGSAFFAESMFHTETNASKMALFHLVRRLNELDYRLLEVQFMTPHLQSLGAIEIPSSDYLLMLRNAVNTSPTGLIAESSNQ